MQVLKDEVRDNIYNAAIKEFRKNGYEKASMRNIAKESGMTVGNMYRYFKNKDDLFYSVISPVYHKVITFVTEQRIPENTDQESENMNIDEQAKRLVEIYLEHKDELLIIIEGSKGSKYEGTKNKIVKIVEDMIHRMLQLKMKSSNILAEDLYLSRVLSVSAIEGLLLIFHYDGEDKQVFEMVKQFIGIMFKDLSDRMGR